MLGAGLVIVRRNVAAREILLDPIEKLRINGHRLSYLPWIGHSFTIQTSPSRSMICALISPTFRASGRASLSSPRRSPRAHL